MKHLLELVPVIILALFLSSCSDQLTDSINDPVDESTKDILLTPGELSAEEIAGLIFMRQEEKVAHDVYYVLGLTHNLSIFTNLVSSEQSHMDAVKKMILKYQLEDPAADETVGVFSDSLFQQMYDDFVAQGLLSPSQAMLVGQTIEQKDIDDLNYFLLSVDNMDIIKMYNKLLSASQRHLAGFTVHITPTD